jgi:dethiobiotin synthetase
LRAASNVLATYGQINPYCFVPPVAPHIAARSSGVRIDLNRILTSFRELSTQAEVVIVEGAGGFLIPLNEKQDGGHLARELALPVIVVVEMRLGCLNHALLTQRVIDDYGLVCAGWVANVLADGMLALNENIEALQQRIAAPMLGVIPYQRNLDVNSVAGMLDISLLEIDEP